MYCSIDAGLGLHLRSSTTISGASPSITAPTASSGCHGHADLAHQQQVERRVQRARHLERRPARRRAAAPARPDRRAPCREPLAERATGLRAVVEGQSCRHVWLSFPHGLPPARCCTNQRRRAPRPPRARRAPRTGASRRARLRVALAGQLRRCPAVQREHLPVGAADDQQGRRAHAAAAPRPPGRAARRATPPRRPGPVRAAAATSAAAAPVLAPKRPIGRPASSLRRGQPVPAPRRAAAPSSAMSKTLRAVRRLVVGQQVEQQRRAAGARAARRPRSGCGGCAGCCRCHARTATRPRSGPDRMIRFAGSRCGPIRSSREARWRFIAVSLPQTKAVRRRTDVQIQHRRHRRPAP